MTSGIFMRAGADLRRTGQTRRRHGTLMKRVRPRFARLPLIAFAGSAFSLSTLENRHATTPRQYQPPPAEFRLAIRRGRGAFGAAGRVEPERAVGGARLRRRREPVV